MRLEKIEEGEEVNCGYFSEYLDLGDCYLLVQRWSFEQDRTVTLSRNTDLRDINGGLNRKNSRAVDRFWITYSKLCKTTFRMYIHGYEGGKFTTYLNDIDEAIKQTEIGSFNEPPFLLLKSLVTEKGLEDLNLDDHFIRWPNEKGGRGEHWYWLLRS
ncbi:MAG: hypothetical protein EB127_20655 [Alphaproteobacteria bacterium]|nr:hypothetical protein [Alphaproteobacteria bacterium]